MVFPVVMYGCESWTIKKAKCWRIDAFELWCFKRLLKVPWTARRSNQSILKEINPEHSLEGLLLKLKLQYSVHLIRKASSLEKALMIGKTEGRRRRGRQRIRWVDGITGSVDMSLSKLWERVEGSGAWHTAVHGVVKSGTWLSSWTSASGTWIQVRGTPASLCPWRECVPYSFPFLSSQCWNADKCGASGPNGSNQWPWCNRAKR